MENNLYVCVLFIEVIQLEQDRLKEKIKKWEEKIYDLYRYWITKK